MPWDKIGWDQSSGMSVKSIQAALITVAAEGATGTATITAVDTDNTWLVWGGQINGDADNDTCSVELTDSTTLTATRVGDYAVEAKIRIYVVEFNPGTIAGVRNGTLRISNGSATGDETITAVDTTKCIVSQLGEGGAGSKNDLRSYLTLVDSTTLRGTRTLTVGNTDVGYSILELL